MPLDKLPPLNRNIPYFHLATLLFICSNSFSQAKFEEGYFITNEGVLVECLIKDMGWVNNPEEFQFLMTPGGAPEVRTVADVKEFGVLERFKFIKAVVGIDRTKGNLSNLTFDRNPELNEERLFLRAVIEGEASLYFYRSKEVERYFFAFKGSNVEPLIHKKYLTNSNKIGVNNYFRQQLLNVMNCQTLSHQSFAQLDYNKNDLLKVFEKYNNCVGADITDYDKTKKKGIFYVGVKGGVTSRSISLKNPNVEEIGPAFNFQAGLSMEYILPVLRNKWSFFLEPSYYQFNGEGEGMLQGAGPVPSNPGATGPVKIDMKFNNSALSLPVGIRHHLFLNQNSRLFVNAGAVYDFIFGSVETVLAADNEVEHKDMAGYLLGLGYSLNNKYSVEFRYISGRTQLKEITYNDRSFSLLLGYTIF